MCFVDGHLAGRGLPTMRVNLEGWRVVQYGLNKDYRVFRNDSPTRAVSLKGFSDWFARCYEKKFPNGSTVLREEFHGAEPKGIEEFVGLISGGLTSVQILNAIYVYAQGVNSLQRQVSELVKRFDQLERVRRAAEAGK